MKNLLWFSLILAGTSLAQPAPNVQSCESLKSKQIAKIQAEIQERLDEFQQATNRGDSSSLGALYDENALLLPPGEEPVIGREAIEAYWRKQVEAGVRIVSQKITTHDLQICRDIVVQVATFETQLEIPGKGVTTSRGKFSAVWKKEAYGTWKLHQDMFDGIKRKA